MNIMIIVIQISVLLFSVIIHEIAHGLVAYRLGDHTAKAAGRLTLNPIPHIDPFMSILLPGLLIFSGSSFIFGGAKPVPVNPVFFKKPERDMMLVSLAGPASNLILALLSIILLKIFMMVPILFNTGTNVFFSMMIMLNIVLAIFNLIPVPPLDGSKILSYFLPYEAKQKYFSIERFGMIIVLVLAISGVFWMLLKPFLFILFKFMILVFGSGAGDVFIVYQLARIFGY